MSAHTGRCFRAWKRTVKRKHTQGIAWNFPIRQKVPLSLRPFMSTAGRHAGFEQMQLGIMRRAEHNAKIGHRPQGR